MKPLPAIVESEASRAMRPSVSIRNVSRVFDGAIAVNDVSLDVNEGEFFSLLGPSGCGKTTLLRIIAGFEQPTAGDLHIAGASVVRQAPHIRKTNMVFQHGALFPHLNVAQNVAFGLEMKKVPAQEKNQRVQEVLDLVRLGEYGHRRVDQLSGGQRQRVALARALVNRPEVLLLDEPLSALDLQLRLQMQDELRRLQRETASTFIFVTHDQGEAMAMSDRLAVMQGGRILQVGTPREIYRKPNCAFVAQFIGHSNFFRGMVTELRNGLATVRTDDGIAFVGQASDGVRSGERALVALRYETLTPGIVGAGPSNLIGTVVDETYVGSTVRVRVRLQGGDVIVSETANTSLEFGAGQPVRLHWPEHSPIVLPAD